MTLLNFNLIQMGHPHPHRLLPFDLGLIYQIITTTILMCIIITPPFTDAKISDYDTDYDISFIPWGGRCKIPKDGELLEIHDGCDGTKGIICQKYSQGNYCGCPIESSFLSYDKRSGECRRKPGELCKYVNTTSHPDVYAKLPRNVKCHEAAECAKRVITSEEALGKKKVQEVNKCICRWGYVRSRDGLGCDSVNKSSSLFNSGCGGQVNFLMVNLLGLLLLLKIWR